MSSFDWKALVKSVAPMLGTALGGPLGGLAGKVVSEALGGEPNDLPKLVSNISQDQLLALKQAEQAFTLHMAELDITSVRDLETIAAGDRASARAREIALRDWTPKALAVGITLGFFGILAYMLKFEIPSSSRDVLNIMLGSLGTAWVSVVGYFFGSSAGSARKDEIIGGQR